MGDFMLLQPISQRLELRSDRTDFQISTWGFPINGPTMTQTLKNFLPTSIPAHRSMAAEIIFVLLSWPESS